MEFIYVISHKRGAGDAEIYSLWNNYAGDICAFYDCNVEIEK